MITAELYKTSHHRTPLVLTGLGALATMAPGAYFLFSRPEAADFYTGAVAAVFSAVGVLVAAVLGGWVLGHEYRQSTTRRVVGLDARRGRLLGAKAVAGIVTFAVMMAAMLAAGLGAAALAAAVNGDALVTANLVRDIGSALIPAAVAAVVAFGASSIFRNDAYATLTSLGLVLIFGPLLSLIPKVGPYMLSTAIGDLSSYVAEPASITNVSTALITATAWIAGFVLVGRQLFVRRDI